MVRAFSAYQQNRNSRHSAKRFRAMTMSWGNVALGYGEWNRKDAPLSDATVKTEYGLTEAFIVEGIRSDRLILQAQKDSIEGTKSK